MANAMPVAKVFEDLWVWQQARDAVKNVYQEFGDETTASRDFGFRSQIQKAAVSIMNNIAEGFERNTDSEFARFLDIARASCGEVRSMYYVAEDFRYVTTETANARRDQLRQLSAAIWKLANKLRRGK